MQKAARFPLLILIVLGTASLACLVNLGGPELPATPVPVSTEAVDSLEDLWEGAVSGAKDDGQLTVVLNESQVTSLLAFKLQEQADPLFQDPQVYLRDGQVQVYGKVRRGTLVANANLVIQVQVDVNGRPRFEVSSADFGPLPVPSGLLDGLSAMLDEAFTGSIGPAASGLRIESIVIDGGLLAITGRIR